MNPFSPQGGGSVHFGVDSNGRILGLGCSRRSHFFLLWTLDPLGPTWGAARAEKYLHPSGTPPQVSGHKNVQKSTFWVRGNDPAWWPKYFSARIRSRNVLSGPSLIKWGYKHFHSPSRTDSMSPWKLRPRALLVNCPSISLKDSGQNFQKFRWSKITSKDTSSTWISHRKMLDKYMHPSGTQGVLKKILLKMAFYPQMRKIDGCAWWVHILGVRRGENKVLYHTFIPYKYCCITPSQTKVMKLWNSVLFHCFLGAFPSKPCMFAR